MLAKLFILFCKDLSQVFALCNMNIILVDGATPNIAFELLTFFAWYTVIFLYMNS